MKCPTCFAILPPQPLRFVCVGPCASLEDPKATAARGYRVLTKPVFDAHLRTPGTGGVCPRCSTPSTQEVCGYCLGAIPRGWRAATVTCVAVAGARSTGKTILLAVAREQLGLLTERHHQSVLRGIGDTDQIMARYYTQPLYEQRRILPPTGRLTGEAEVAREPLMFEFQQRQSDGSVRTRILTLRDVPGEDLEQGDNDQALAFFSRADAVIVLVDPLTVRQIRALLADLISLEEAVGRDGADVLRYVLRLMTEHAPGRRTTIPIAVVLSKVDALQRLREVRGTTWAEIMDRPGSPLQRDPSLSSGGYDADDGGLVHEEVRGLLEELQAGIVDHMLHETADRYHFFAVSALGASPKGELLHSGGIAPFRVVDPFTWILSQQ